MSYCPNPRCGDRLNADTATHCHHCHTSLLLQDRYTLVRPLREIDEWEPIDVFAVEDWKGDEHQADEKSQAKVLKLLKNKRFQPSFEREATTLQRLNHEGIPQVASDGYFSCEIAGQDVFCLVMERIQGINLEDWLDKNGPIDQPTAIDWLTQILDILDQIHQQELFHRDIKLSNIMRRPTGRLALVDFGAVRPMTNTYFAKVGSGGLRDVTSVVSPGYTPAEQMDGRAVPQSDFYSLGRSLVHLLTGQHPIDLPKDEETGLLVWRDQLKHPIDEWLLALLDSMMATFPGQRPANVDILKKRLTPLLSPNAPQPSSTPSPSNKSSLDWLLITNIGLLLVQLWLGQRLLSIYQYRHSNEALAQPSIVTVDISTEIIEA